MWLSNKGLASLVHCARSPGFTGAGLRGGTFVHLLFLVPCYSQQIQYFTPFEHVQAICGTFFTGTVRCTLLTYSIFYPFDPNQKDRLCRNRVV